MEQSKQLRRRFYTALVALLITLITIAGATFAWYIYNTSVHTTSVRMAAGTGGAIQISKEYDGVYSTSAVLDAFVGKLTPVSTNSILGGFQKVTEFLEEKKNGQWRKIAAYFDTAEESDYYKTSLFLRASETRATVYISNIGFEDSDEENPISTAIRVGFVVHEPGENQDAAKEFIFSINDKANPKGGYNTLSGVAGYVLDSSKSNGATVPFKPLTKKNYCIYNPETGETSERAGSRVLCVLDGAGAEPTQVDIYIWLEGCDEDCRENLTMTTLQNISVSFAAIEG